jgi:hypothetical protein
MYQLGAPPYCQTVAQEMTISAMLSAGERLPRHAMRNFIFI